MKEFVKCSGPVFVIIGLVILAVYCFGKGDTKVILFSAIAIMLIGMATRVWLNKKVD